MARFVATVSTVSANGIRMVFATVNVRFQMTTSDICKCLKVGADSGAGKEKIKGSDMAGYVVMGALIGAFVVMAVVVLVFDGRE